MLTASIYADETDQPNSSMPQAAKNETALSLLGLLDLARNAAEEAGIAHPDDALNGVIARPTLRMLLSAMKHRDAATVRHCRRVANLSVGLARNLGWEPPDQKVLEVASLLHDVGKIGIPDNILFKPGRLNADETALMALHYCLGVDVLQACQADVRVSEFIADGIGRPPEDDSGFGRALSDIHQGARILCVADAYDSLAHDQVFREGKDHDDILEILMKDTGRRYDGNVVCALARWIEREGVPACVAADEGFGDVSPPPSGSPEIQEAERLTEIFSHLYTVESLYDGLFLLDKELRIVVWNPGAENVLQRPAREMLGKTWSPTLLGYAGELGQALPDGELPLQKALTSGRMHMGGIRMRRQDGTWAELQIQALPLLDERGQLRGIAEILTDQQSKPQLPADYRELKLAASRDALTAVANRAELESQLSMLLDHWRDSDEAEPFSIIFLDIDFFKNINDTFGHTVGDQVLIDTARLLQRESYSGELVARYGGEEFVILCPATHLEQAVRRAERLRAAVTESKIGGIGNYRVTASFGVTQVERKDSAETVLRRADRALYTAKESGRNKTCSLTTEQEGTSDHPPEEERPAATLEFQAEFQACLAADMIVYKLGGVVNDQKAKLKEVTDNRVRFRLGTTNLLGGWGSSPSRQPVDVTIDFSSRSAPNPGRRAAAVHAEVKVNVKPIGLIRNAEKFQSRARQVFKMIRSYFVAD